MRTLSLVVGAEHAIQVLPKPDVRYPAARGAERQLDVPSEADVRALLKACSGPKFEDRRDYALIMVMADGGPRCSELVGLRVEDVDLDEHVLLVTGKGRRPRGVPIGNKTVAALDRYLRVRANRKAADRPELWLGKQGPLTDSAVRQILTRRGRASGVRLHPHQLRHYFADRDLAGDQLRQAGLLGQRHHRHQPRTRHEVLVIEQDVRSRPAIG